MHRYSDGKRDDGGGSHREVPAAPAGGRDERRQARFDSAARCSEDPGVELGWRVFGSELAVALRNLRVALVTHLAPRPSASRRRSADGSWRLPHSIRWRPRSRQSTGPPPRAAGTLRAARPAAPPAPARTAPGLRALPAASPGPASRPADPARRARPGKDPFAASDRPCGGARRGLSLVELDE